MAKSSSMSKTAVWILLGLLILGLAGFGATNLGGNIRTVGTVGDKPITTQAYFTAMQREMQQYQEQTGQSLTFARASELGIDRVVMQRMILLRALDHEATELIPNAAWRDLMMRAVTTHLDALIAKYADQ